jgi:hypothetical protein
MIDVVCNFNSIIFSLESTSHLSFLLLTFTNITQLQEYKAII